MIACPALLEVLFVIIVRRKDILQECIKAYYAKWIANFSKKIKNLKNTKIFPMDEGSVTEFETLKKGIAGASFSAIDKTLPFVVE